MHPVVGRPMHERSPAGGHITEPELMLANHIVTGEVRTATVVASTSATIIRLTSQQSAEFLQKPEIEGKLVRTVTARLASANDAILEKTQRYRELEGALSQLLTDMKLVYDDFKELDELDAQSQEILRRIRVNVNKVDMMNLLTKRTI